MIEFDSIVGAQRAKAALNGVDIYRGCCTIKGKAAYSFRIALLLVEYAKPQSLNVFKNDDNTRDFRWTSFMIRLFNVVLALKTGIMRGNFASLTHRRWALIHHMVCPCLATYIIISLGILIRVICPWTNTASLPTVVIHTEDACTASHIPTSTAWVLIIHKKPGMVV